MSALIAAYVAPESDKEASSTSLSAYSTGRRSAKRRGLRRKHSARLGESIAHRSGSFRHYGRLKTRKGPPFRIRAEIRVVR